MKKSEEYLNMHIKDETEDVMCRSEVLSYGDLRAHEAKDELICQDAKEYLESCIQGQDANEVVSLAEADFALQIQSSDDKKKYEEVIQNLSEQIDQSIRELKGRNSKEMKELLSAVADIQYAPSDEMDILNKYREKYGK